MQVPGAAAVDKALLSFHGQTLLELALGKVRAVCGDAAILGGPAERCDRLSAFGRVVPDAVTGKGPVAGLAAALGDAAEEWVVMVPVDVPFLPATALEDLVEVASRGGVPAVAIYQTVEHPQPLPLAVHRAALPVVLAALENDERKLLPLLWKIAQTMDGRVHVVRVDPVKDAWFTNVNTPEELRAAEEVV